MYKTCKYNLSIASKILSDKVGDLKNKRAGNGLPPDNIPLLQEIAYIKHKELILKYIDDIKTSENQRYKELKCY